MSIQVFGSGGLPRNFLRIGLSEIECESNFNSLSQTNTFESNTCVWVTVLLEYFGLTAPRAPNRGMGLRVKCPSLPGGPQTVAPPLLYIGKHDSVVGSRRYLEETSN